MAVVATLSKGYDLDYIWKQVDREPARDPVGYYIQASESGGEPPGRWWGVGAKALGLEHGQIVECGPYDLLFGQRKGPDGTPLGKPPDGGRRIADLQARLLAAEPHATADRKHEHLPLPVPGNTELLTAVIGAVTQQVEQVLRDAVDPSKGLAAAISDAVQAFWQHVLADNGLQLMQYELVVYCRR